MNTPSCCGPVIRNTVNGKDYFYVCTECKQEVVEKKDAPEKREMISFKGITDVMPVPEFEAWVKSISDDGIFLRAQNADAIYFNIGNGLSTYRVYIDASKACALSGAKERRDNFVKSLEAKRILPPLTDIKAADPLLNYQEEIATLRTEVWKLEEARNEIEDKLGPLIDRLEALEKAQHASAPQKKGAFESACEHASDEATKDMLAAVTEALYRPSSLLRSLPKDDPFANKYYPVPIIYGSVDCKNPGVNTVIKALPEFEKMYPRYYSPLSDDDNDSSED